MFSIDIFIIKDLSRPILGRFAIVKLGIIKFNSDVDPVAFSVKNISSEIYDFQEYHKLLNELSTFKTWMNMYLKEGVQPFVQSVPMIVGVLKPLKSRVRTGK